MKKRFCLLALILCFVVSAANASDFTEGTLTAEQKEGWLWPVPGCFYLSRGFNTAAGSMHGALDIAPSSAGGEVLAARDGTVVVVYSGCNNTDGYNSGNHCNNKSICSPKKNGVSNATKYNGCCNSGYGNGVIIKHDNGTYT